MPVFRTSIIAAAVAFGLIAAMGCVIHWHVARREVRSDGMYAPARPSPVPLVAAELNPMASSSRTRAGVESSPPAAKARAALNEDR